MSAPRTIIDLTLDSEPEIEETYCEIRDDTLRPPAPDQRHPLVFTVERILDSRLTAAGRVYLVKWFGYPIAEATWEHERNLQCDDALNAFYTR